MQSLKQVLTIKVNADLSSDRVPSAERTQVETMNRNPRHRHSKLSLIAALGLIALGLLPPGVARAEQAFSFDATPGKLPKSVVPTHYAIELAPDLQALTAGGSEIIDIEVCETPW